MDKITAQTIYEFDNFRLDPGHRVLSRAGKDIELAPKAVETLVALVEHRGQVISKDELLAVVWPDTIVDESNLFSYLSHLRKALGNRRDGKPYVETLRRRGYRFTGDVRIVSVNRPPTPLKIVPHAANGRSVDSGPVRHSTGTGNVVVVAKWLQEEPAVDKLRIAEVGIPEARMADTSRSRATDKNAKRRGSLILTVLSLLVLCSVGVYFWRASSNPAPAPFKTIAVMPLEPLGNEPRDERLEFRIPDTLISKLNSTGEINAWPLNSVLKIAGADRDAVSVGRDLGVDFILQGNYQTSNGRIRVSVQLFETTEARAVWGRPFEEEFGDFFSAQDAIAMKVAKELRPQLTPDAKTRMAKRGTNSEEAEQLFTYGRYHVGKLSLPETQTGITYLQQALELDPNYALAYVELANAYRSQTLSGDLRAAEVLPYAKEAALKALAIDPDLAEAHVAAGHIALWYDRNWSEAEKQAKTALDLEPNNHPALYLLENVYSFLGRHDEAIACGKRAREIDPLSFLYNSIEAQTLLYADRVDEALERAMKARELEDNFWHVHMTLARIYLEKKMYQEAIAEADRAVEISPGNSYALAVRGYALARSGAVTEAKAIIDELLKRSNRGRFHTNVALVYTGLGDKESALEHLERGFEEEEMQQELKSSPGWRDLRVEPRFVELTKKMNLTE